MIIELLLLAGLLAVVGFMAAGVAYSRRLAAGQTREQNRDRDAVAAYRNRITITLLPQAREDLSDGAPKTLEQWLAEDERILLRAEVTADLAWWSQWELRNDARARASADRLMRDLFGYTDGVTGWQADELIAACHFDRGELIDLVNATCEWPQDWQDELQALLTQAAMPA